MRPELEAVLRQLLSRGERVLDLDDVAESLGTIAVSADDVSALFTALEHHGCTIGQPSSPPPSETLRVVLITARALRLERGEVPTASEIAERAGIPLEAVRRALFFARVAQR
jgi:hypothetical protein